MASIHPSQAIRNFTTILVLMSITLRLACVQGPDRFTHRLGELKLFLHPVELLVLGYCLKLADALLQRLEPLGVAVVHFCLLPEHALVYTPR